MATIRSDMDELRRDAARLACAVLRFEEGAAHLSRASTPPGALRIGAEAYTFIPSWRPVPRGEVEAFLVGLPSPTLLAPTTTRGVIALLLLHELSGERLRWAEKTLSNFGVILDEIASQLGLTPVSRILLEFDDESHVFSFGAVREWSQTFPVQVGWNIGPLERDPQADARMGLIRGDGRWFNGRSCMRPRPPSAPG